jgi:hypothetical protein
MSYYFPFGGGEAITTQNISFSLSATTASVPTVNTITALTASFASAVVNSPPAGTNGINVTLSDCQTSASLNPSLLVSGAAGNQGPTGSKGTDVLICPTGTVRCMDLEVSLSAQFLSGTGQRGVNYFQPSGSQFSIVCMQVPTTCSSAQAQAGCPQYLRITSPSIP